MALAKLIFHLVPDIFTSSDDTTADKDYYVYSAVLLYLEVLFGVVFTQGRLARDMFLFVFPADCQ